MYVWEVSENFTYTRSLTSRSCSRSKSEIGRLMEFFAPFISLGPTPWVVVRRRGRDRRRCFSRSSTAVGQSAFDRGVFTAPRRPLRTFTCTHTHG